MIRLVSLPYQAPSAYEDSLKSSVIIPTPVLERETEKYINNNNNISNLSHPSSLSTNAVALKIEEVSNETSNLMIEERQNHATRWTRLGLLPFARNLNFTLPQLNDRSDDNGGEKRQQQAAVQLRGPHRYHSLSCD